MTSKTHNGIEYKGGEAVYVSGHASRYGMLIGNVVGFTKRGQFKVLVSQGPRVGETVRSFWVSPYKG
jgi:hypothetical protein